MTFGSRATLFRLEGLTLPAEAAKIPGETAPRTREGDLRIRTCYRMLSADALVASAHEDDHE